MAKESLTVKDLKEIIANLPDDMQVVIQRDSGGNGYRLAYAADPDCIWDQNEDSILSTNYTGEQNGIDEPEEWERMLKESPRVLVIAP
jgi:hypothetical protein